MSINRLLILDNLRGIAFILMFIQHLFYFYDVSKYYKTNLANNSFINLSGYLARNLFIFLAGYSMVISYKNNKKKFIKKRLEKSLLILGHAAIISLVTYYFYPEFYIRFGVLHFIGLATFLLSFLVPYPKLYIIILLIVLLIKPPKINVFLDTILGSNIHYQMMDWFPLLKWLPIMIGGMIFGSLPKLNIGTLSKLNINFLNKKNILTFFGKNSLNLYTIHIIILILFYKIINI
jgi:uncharacterized membrane protein